ncbi:MAG: hypothetical protein HN353_04875 [Bdellovibrionales bacterium]|nr:hypothetical protein [Bdellovibrionales bacterium]MBT7669992.1 hypothetical protein [Bdellovibrionales bacterium]MBT7766368.1 hypothetical protein [Bdellovibrionales bacterium]
MTSNKQADRSYQIVTILLLTIMLLVSGCGSSGGKSTVKFNAFESITSAFNSAGESILANNPGGIMLFGRMHEDPAQNFALRITGAETSKELDSGTWDFRVIAWQGEYQLTGTPKCDLITGIDLEGQEVNIDLSISKSNCDDTIEFKPLMLITCKVPVGEVNNPGDCAATETRGSAKSFRVFIPELQVDHQPNPLHSHCITTQTTDNSGNVSSLDPVYRMEKSPAYSIPIETSHPHKIEVGIKAFESNNCSGAAEDFIFWHGLTGPRNGAKHQYDTTDTYHKIYMQSGSGGTHNNWVTISDDIIDTSNVAINGRPFHSYLQIVNITSGSDGEFTELATSGSFSEQELTGGDNIVWAVMAGTSDAACGTNIGTYGWGSVEMATSGAISKIVLDLKNPILGTFNNTTNSYLNNPAITSGGNTFCRIQVVRLPEIDNLEVVGETDSDTEISRLSISPPEFDMASGTGGILPLKINEILKVTNGVALKLNAKGKGFKGGHEDSLGDCDSGGFGDGYQGKLSPESDVNSNNSSGGAPSADSRLSYSGGGGAGYVDGEYIPGGSSSSSGIALNGCKPYNRCMLLGGGGGGGCGKDATGGNGGGVILLHANSVEGKIEIDISGGDGSAGITSSADVTSGLSGGGGGGGGMALVMTDRMDNAFTNPELNISKDGGNGEITSGDAISGGAGYGMVSITSGGMDSNNADNLAPHISVDFDYYPNGTPASPYRLAERDDMPSAVSGYSLNQMEAYYPMMNQTGFYIPTDAAELPIDIAFSITSGTNISLGVVRVTSSTSTSITTQYHVEKSGGGTVTQTGNGIMLTDGYPGQDVNSDGATYDFFAKGSNNNFRLVFPGGAVRITK